MLNRSDTLENKSDILKEFSILLSPTTFSKEILRLIVKKFHEEWFNFLTQNKYTLLLAPRGSGKSTINSIAYPIWKCIIDPKIRIIIVSNTFEQAKSFGRATKNYFESGKMQQYFGNLAGEPWSPQDLRLKNHGDLKESNITTLGVGGSMLGRHFDIGILDDVCDDENTNTSGQRRKVLEWYQKIFLPAIEPKGEIHVVGTVFHSDDLYHNIADDPSFLKNTYDAEGYQGGLLWPERLSREFLDNRKFQMGSVLYNMQYRNKIITDETSIFKEGWFRFYNKLPDNVDYYQGVDLAISEKGDFFVITTIAKEPNTGLYYLVDIFKGHYSLSQQFDHIIQKAENYHPIKIAIESNSYQKVVSDELKRNTALPVRAINQFKDKVTRARQLSVLFENGSLLFPRNSKMVEKLTTELLTFPRAKYDDQIDSLELATRISQKGEKWDWTKLKSTIYTGNYLQKV